MSHQQRIFTTRKCSKFETFKLMLKMDLTVLQTKLDHVVVQKEIKSFSLAINFSTFKNFYFDPKVAEIKLFETTF